MTNESGITPLGHRVLIYPTPIEEKEEKSLIVKPDSVRDREEMHQADAIVVAVGESCWKDQAVGEWAKPGDRIIFAKFQGTVWEGKDGKKYRLISDLDVVARLED